MQKGAEKIKMLYIAANIKLKYDILQCTPLLPDLFFSVRWQSIGNYEKAFIY